MGKKSDFLGMLDKIDDIIYEPIHLMCDALRQPLKQCDDNRDKKNKEHELELQKDMERFQMEMELERKDKEQKLSAEEQRMQIEIDKMLKDSDLQYKEKLAQIEKNFRIEMSESAGKLAKFMASTQAEVRKQVEDLYIEKTKEYLAIQNEHKKQLYEDVKAIKDIFPGGEGDDIIKDEIKTQMNDIVQQTREFQQMLNRDTENLLKMIDEQMREITGIATKYFQPVAPNQPALTQTIINQIEDKE